MGYSADLRDYRRNIGARSWSNFWHALSIVFALKPPANINRLSVARNSKSALSNFLPQTLKVSLVTPIDVKRLTTLSLAASNAFMYAM